jgi:glycosyltransferase involved in cell wall biosynthesis
MHLCDKFGIRGARTHGVSRLFTWWFPRFDASCFDVRLVGIPPEDEASAYLRRQGLDPVCLGRNRFSPAVAADLLRLVRRERPHILHTHGYATSNFARLVAGVTDVRTIIHEHAAFPNVPVYQRPVDRLLVGRTDMGIAVSSSTKAFMIRHRFLPANKIHVVWNGAPLEEFKVPSAERVQAARERLGLPPGETVVGTVGRLDGQKGTTYFLQAAAQVIGRKPGVRFVVAGDGPLLESYREEARALGVAERTVFTGFYEDVPALLSLLDVQVFASLWEGTPLTVFEAMSMSRPMVSTAVDGLGEVLRDGENALLAPPRDPSALAGAVLRLLETPALGAALAARAEVDSHRFDVRRTVGELERLYVELVERGP